MLTGKETVISSQYHQVKVGGDIAVILGICKHVFAADDKAKANGSKRILDTAFIEQHTSGLDEFEAKIRETSWEKIEAGL
jgi:anaerobic selenocysteine-containing dehydrogenase